MGGLLAAFESGKSSIFVNQKGIEVTGNNIANVNTDGYSRQKLDTTPFPTVKLGSFFVGHGVQVTGISSERDSFLTRQLQDKSANLGEESAKSAPLAELEDLFNISDYNLAADIDRYFDAWQQLSANPGGYAERGTVIQRGQALADTFNNLGQEMLSIKNYINDRIESKVGAVNLQLQEVADLNKEIAGIENNGNEASSLRDRRDILLEKLSFSLGISYYEENGMVNVNLPAGLPLISDTMAYSFVTSRSGNDLTLSLGIDSRVVEIDAYNQSGGELKGLTSIRDQFIPALQDSLDKLAYTLVNNVNTQHAAGYGLDNVTSRDFFTALSTQTNASLLIAVNITDAGQVAAGASSDPGDNTNALLMTDLGSSKAIDSAYTFTDYYASLVSTVGIEVSQSNLNQAGTEDSVNQLRNLRDGITGVSLEEEMINLIKYQRGFEAASKLLVTVDEMMQTLLTIKR